MTHDEALAEARRRWGALGDAERPVEPFAEVVLCASYVQATTRGPLRRCTALSVHGAGCRGGRPYARVGYVVHAPLTRGTSEWTGETYEAAFALVDKLARRS